MALSSEASTQGQVPGKCPQVRAGDLLKERDTLQNIKQPLSRYTRALVKMMSAHTEALISHPSSPPHIPPFLCHFKAQDP